MLFVSAAYGTGCAALEIVPDGDKWTVHEKWANKNLQTHMATAIVHDGCVYGCDGDLGSWSLRCLDLKTGEVRWKERLPCRCSFVAAEGCLFVPDREGDAAADRDQPRQVRPQGRAARPAGVQGVGYPRPVPQAALPA